MDTFFLKTMPEIYIEHCMFDTLDCRHIWKLRKTKLGNCVQELTLKYKCLTFTLSGFEILNDASLIIQNFQLSRLLVNIFYL